MESSQKNKTGTIVALAVCAAVIGATAYYSMQPSSRLQGQLGPSSSPSIAARCGSLAPGKRGEFCGASNCPPGLVCISDGRMCGCVMTVLPPPTTPPTSCTGFKPVPNTAGAYCGSNNCPGGFICQSDSKNCSCVKIVNSSETPCGPVTGSATCGGGCPDNKICALGASSTCGCRTKNTVSCDFNSSSGICPIPGATCSDADKSCAYVTGAYLSLCDCFTAAQLIEYKKSYSVFQ